MMAVGGRHLRQYIYFFYRASMAILYVTSKNDKSSLGAENLPSMKRMHICSQTMGVNVEIFRITGGTLNTAEFVTVANGCP